jgi:hypothetical protein
MAAFGDGRHIGAQLQAALKASMVLSQCKRGISQRESGKRVLHRTMIQFCVAFRGTASKAFCSSLGSIAAVSEHRRNSDISPITEF